MGDVPAPIEEMHMPAMRDTKGRFKQGFDGMRPVGLKKAKLKSFKAKQPEKTLNVPVNNRSTGFANPGTRTIPTSAPENARVNVNVGALKRGPSLDGSTGVRVGGAKITKTQGAVTRGDVSTGMASVKLSKGQKDRLATRDKNMLTGARNKKKRLAGGEQANPAQAVQAENNAKLQDARTMTPAQKISNYQDMHGKKPSAAAAKMLEIGAARDRHKAEDQKRADLEAKQRASGFPVAKDAARDKYLAKSLKDTRDRELREINAKYAPGGKDQQTVVSPKRETARDFAERTTVNKPTEFSKAELDAAQKKIDELTAKGILKPGGKDTQKVVAPKAPKVGKSEKQIELEGRLAAEREAAKGDTAANRQAEWKARMAYGSDVEAKRESARFKDDRRRRISGLKLSIEVEKDRIKKEAAPKLAAGSTKDMKPSGPPGSFVVSVGDGGDGGLYSKDGFPIDASGKSRPTIKTMKDGTKYQSFDFTDPKFPKSGDPQLDKARKDLREAKADEAEWARELPGRDDHKLAIEHRQKVEREVAMREGALKSATPGGKPSAAVVSPSELAAQRKSLEAEEARLRKAYVAAANKNPNSVDAKQARAALEGAVKKINALPRVVPPFSNFPD
jgi:hypothetical protein